MTSKPRRQLYHRKPLTMKAIKKIPYSATTPCHGCKRLLPRRELGIFCGELRCQDCWPKDMVDESSVHGGDGGPCARSQAGYSVPAFHGGIE